MDTLTFDIKKRLERKDSRGRVVQNERTYFDYLISGISLKTILNSDNLDLISPFGWGDKNYEHEIIKMFVGEKMTQIPSGRLMIYVCPECGDIGCGSVTVNLEITNDKIIWKDFGFENNDPEIDYDSYNRILPIVFDKQDYMIKLQNLIR